MCDLHVLPVQFFQKNHRECFWHQPAVARSVICDLKNLFGLPANDIGLKHEVSMYASANRLRRGSAGGGIQAGVHRRQN